LCPANSAAIAARAVAVAQRLPLRARRQHGVEIVVGEKLLIVVERGRRRSRAAFFHLSHGLSLALLLTAKPTHNNISAFPARWEHAIGPEVRDGG